MKKIIIVILVFLSFSAFAQKKPIITVLDFRIDGVSRSEMTSITSFLSSALFKTGKFILIDAQERDTLLNELEFSLSNCSEESCLIEIGKLLSAEYVITGNIGKVGSRYLLTIKMLETQTGKTSNSVEGVYYSIDEIVDDLYNLAASLADMDVKELAMEDKETGIPTDDREDDASIRAEDDTSVADTMLPDSDDTVTGPDTSGKKAGTNSAHFALGAGAGITFPLGELNTMMESTYTPFTYLDYLFSFNRGSFGIGLFLGIQVENTTPEYPDYAYELLSVPVAFHSRLTMIVIKPIFISIDASIGAAVNNVDYEEDATMSDLVTSKFFLSPGLGLGITLGSSFRLYFYNNFFLINFDKNTYSAYSAGLACELSF